MSPSPRRPEWSFSRSYPYPVVYCKGEVRRLHGKGPTGLRSTFAQAFVPVLQCKRNGFELVKQCDGIASTGIWSGQRLRLLICFHSRLCGTDCVLAIQSNINTEKCNSIFGKNTKKHKNTFFLKKRFPNLEPKWFPKRGENELKPNRLFHFVVPQIWEPFWFQNLEPTCFAREPFLLFFCVWKIMLCQPSAADADS